MGQKNGQWSVSDYATCQELAKKSDPPIVVDPQSASSDSPSDVANRGPKHVSFPRED